MKNTNENTLPTSPDWSTAPKWALWFTIDENGAGAFWNKEPFENGGIWRLYSGRFTFAGYFSTENWKGSLQKRHNNA